MEKSIIKYKQYGDCVAISNGAIEIIATLEFGPRVLCFGLSGHPNLLYEQPPDSTYLTAESGWRLYGGHRLWLAPECEKTYWPDNSPVEYEFINDGFVLMQSLDEFLNARKRIKIRFTDCPNTAEITLMIENAGSKTLVGAPWAVTAMRPGGVMRVPFYSEEMSATPKRFISLWGNTSLADERLEFKENEVVVRHLPIERYFKIGLNCSEGIARYDVCGQSFIKRFLYDACVVYPDNNVNFEVFCCKHMIEIESLAALSEILPGEIAQHVEHWSVFNSND